MSTVTDPCQQGRLFARPRASRSTRCGQLHSEAIAMLHPLYHLDLHHDRARSLQRAAHERLLLAEAARQPVLREGTPDDVLLHVDPTLLVDASEELNVPAAI
jgi:hypothetical protein